MPVALAPRPTRASGTAVHPAPLPSPYRRLPALKGGPRVLRERRARQSASRALCRARTAEELQRRRGTRIGEHSKLVLSIIDRHQER